MHKPENHTDLEAQYYMTFQLGTSNSVQ